MTRPVFLALLSLAAAASAHAQAPAQASDGNALFQRTCAQCHMGGVNRAPDMDALRAMSADRVLAAVETGPMISMATARTAAERRAISEPITGEKVGDTLAIPPPP